MATKTYTTVQLLCREPRLETLGATQWIVISPPHLPFGRFFWPCKPSSIESFKVQNSHPIRLGNNSKPRKLHARVGQSIDSSIIRDRKDYSSLIIHPSKPPRLIGGNSSYTPWQEHSSQSLQTQSFWINLPAVSNSVPKSQIISLWAPTSSPKPRMTTMRFSKRKLAACSFGN